MNRLRIWITRLTVLALISVCGFAIGFLISGHITGGLVLGVSTVFAALPYALMRGWKV